MTADSRGGDKTHSESSVTQNCSFQGLIVFKNTLCNEEGALSSSPSFSRSSHQLSTHLAVRQTMLQMDGIFIIIEPTALILRMPRTRSGKKTCCMPSLQLVSGRGASASASIPRPWLRLLYYSDILMCFCYSVCSEWEEAGKHSD